MCVLVAVAGARDSAAQGVQSPAQETVSRAPSPVTERAMSGAVVDSQGGGIRGAKVTLRSADASWRAQQTTAEAGRYRFAAVAAGPLVLEVEAAGFRSHTQTVAPDTDTAEIRLDIATVTESLTVTVGTRGPMVVGKSPVSTSLVTREEMELRNVHQVDRALTLTEGVNGARARGPGDNDFNVGLRGFSGMGGSYRTLILIDGQPVNNSYIGAVNWSTLAPSEIDRIEVARGPFSSLYGGNAMGGVINLVTRPIDNRDVELVGQYGNRDTVSYSARVGDRFFGRLGLSLGMSGFRTDGYRSQEVLRPLAATTGGVPVTGVTRWSTPAGGVTYQVGAQGRNWFEQRAYRVRGEYTVSPRLFATVQYMRQSREGGYSPYASSLRDASGAVVDSGTVSFVEGGTIRRLTVAPANFIGIPTAQASNIYQAQVLATPTTNWSVRVAAGIHDSPHDWFVSPGASATLEGGPGSYTDTSGRAIYASLQATRAALAGSIVAGTESRIDRANSASRPIPNYLSREDGGAFDTQAFGRTVNHAAYVQYQRTFLDRLNVVSGGRVDYWRTYDGASQAGSQLPLTQHPERSTLVATGKIAAAYSLPGNWQVRGSVGNAFRNPTIYEMYRDFFFFGSFLLGNPNARAEHLLAYEGGVSHAFGAGHSFNATAYENRISDLIYRTVDRSDPTGATRRLANAALARGRGFEFAATQRPISRLQLRQFYTLTSTVITRNPGVPETVGKQAPFLPRHTAGYQATAVLGRVDLSWDGRYVGAMYSSGANTDITKGVPGGYDPFFEMGVSGTFRATPKVSFVANVDNVLDRQYHLFYLAQGRSVFAGLRVRP
jgi:iron complex outermembrane receptor protein